MRLNVIITWFIWLFSSTQKNYYLPQFQPFIESGGKGLLCPAEPMVFLRTQLDALSFPPLTLSPLYLPPPSTTGPAQLTLSPDPEVTRCSHGYSRNKSCILIRIENCVSLHKLRLMVSFFGSQKLASLPQCSLLNTSHGLSEILKFETGPQTQKC